MQTDLDVLVDPHAPDADAAELWQRGRRRRARRHLAASGVTVIVLAAGVAALLDAPTGSPTIFDPAAEAPAPSDAPGTPGAGDEGPGRDGTACLELPDLSAVPTVEPGQRVTVHHCTDAAFSLPGSTLRYLVTDDPAADALETPAVAALEDLVVGHEDLGLAPVATTADGSAVVGEWLAGVTVDGSVLTVDFGPALREVPFATTSGAQFQQAVLAAAALDPGVTEVRLLLEGDCDAYSTRFESEGCITLGIDALYDPTDQRAEGDEVGEGGEAGGSLAVPAAFARLRPDGAVLQVVATERDRERRVELDPGEDVAAFEQFDGETVVLQSRGPDGLGAIEVVDPAGRRVLVPAELGGVLVGSVRDGDPAALVAIARAPAGDGAAPVDLWQYGLDGDAGVLVEDVADAGEGSVLDADASGDVVTWLATSEGVTTAWTSRGGATRADRTTLHRVEDGAERLVGASIADDGAGPVVALLVSTVAGFPAEPTTRIDLYATDGRPRAAIELPVSWADGFGDGLRRNDDGLLLVDTSSEGAVGRAIVVDPATGEHARHPQPGRLG